ncbi:hypothetical protein BDA96_05G137400 [Sorghum bicolor]|uniref:Sacsin/Nov domain-containing protein n=2 Tax=Sorghum bicolor TaxID=4558 RepID=A0A921UFA5_SORBI|nr:uncharacterized protein LOC8055022 [Sorghum bicolor]XP_021316432.1 uncharacterized protein LOC8055022 [Sorghum bicolor]KAG0529902.1 hypothetical protein BDA96_05G137400 [Sorghum bicolor]OQU83492.1 hypothetical protein SORBI_3005G125000 [Sorghum bicolor]|eukprot:XP_021316431.1 uncharacterized protein LOC8055022 [Sorghum bicolor]
MSSSSAMPPPASPREHVERIRRERYYIGRGEQNPLAEDMHQAVNYLSQELYSKDVHFLMELVQNAEDNEYPSGVAPSLEFLITSKDITGSGASSTLLIFNNERGFSSTNIDSICRVGKSTKKGSRHHGYIGEKGIGFKSVFLISSQPHIFSNGYQIKFNEKPCAECNIGYIVPEWVESGPTLSDIKAIYGCSKILPTTTIILPLKSEKVDAVKKQLSSLHPEMLLFLSKIRKLSVQEHNSDPKSITVSEISISSEKNYQARKNMHAESYTLHLSSEESGKGEEECGYYMWKQKFPVKPEYRVDKRAEIDEWVITLAFPHGQRLSRGKQLSPGVYAFLPTEMVTNFPFIIQADFLLASSREAILFDSLWNKGILECVPSAFMNALVTLVKSRADAPAMCLPSMFNFLPVNSSLIPLLEPVRSSIKYKVLAEDIVPCESYASQKIFCKPSEVARLKPAFWTILGKARESGVDLKSLSTHGTYILSSHFDNSRYNSVLEFLGIKSVSTEWYAKCIEGSNLVKEVHEELYLEILHFVASNWGNYFSGTNMMSVPLLKYVDRNGVLSFWSISRASQRNDRLCTASDMNCTSWLISWNKEFPSSNQFFLHPSTQAALDSFSQKMTVESWLRNHARMEVVSVYSYGLTVAASLSNDRRPVIAFAHVLYHSFKMNYIEKYCLSELFRYMPVIDSGGCVVKERKSIIVPAKGSKWADLLGSNPWRNIGYIELLASGGHFAGNYTSKDQLLEFLKIHLHASDVPFIRPPNARFHTVSSPLTVDNAFLLLEWIRNIKSDGVSLPDRFLACVKEGNWLKTSVGYKPPNESFLSSANWGSLLQSGTSFIDIPMIDQQFYRNKLHMYKQELKAIGVRFEFQEASSYIGSRLMSMAASNVLARDCVYSLLRLIRFLREKVLSPSQLIDSVKDGCWMKSTLGYRRPSDCIIKDSEWAVASCISDQPFLDVKFYGEGILSYKSELELLGVIVGFKNNYHLVIDNFKFRSSAITSESTVLILKCIRYVSSCQDFIKKLRDLKWVKTNVGFCAPNVSFLVDSEWECLVQIFKEVPIIDLGFYGSVISSYKEELKKAGLITRFEEASIAIANVFNRMVSESSLTKANVLALLLAYRQLRTHRPLPVELFNCMRTEKWIHTSLGFQSPSNTILFDNAWQYLSPIAILPFIDDGDTCNGLGTDIYGYKDELRELGVTVEVKFGARFVLAGLSIPHDPSIMSKATILSFLECIKNYFASATEPPKGFKDQISKKWLKTSLGYQCPAECILFDAKQCFLQMEDGPFIDEAFYGSDIASFKHPLAMIGVTVDVNCAQDLIARYMRNKKDTNTISRIYMYLKKCNWKPDKNNNRKWIWIPKETEGGDWVSSKSCVLHDKNNLFGLQLHVLDKYYDRKLLDFFSLAFSVRHGPCSEDYCKLWATWESSVHELAISDCFAFWKFIATNWTKKTEELLSGCVKVPVCTDGKIILINKENVFIPDDLLLADLFSEHPQQSLFIWYASSAVPSMSRARFNCIYGSIGVKTISKAVTKNDSFPSANSRFKTVVLSKVIKFGLLQIVLAFLSNPAFDIPAEDRHKMVSCLLNVTIEETDEPITMAYSVSLSSGEVVEVKARRMLRWERENSKLYMQRTGGASSYKDKIEFATYFAHEISHGLLFQMPDQISSLAELIKIGSLLNFQQAAVAFLLKSKNLQLFPEDEDFLFRSKKMKIS